MPKKNAVKKIAGASFRTFNVDVEVNVRVDKMISEYMEDDARNGIPLLSFEGEFKVGHMTYPYANLYANGDIYFFTDTALTEMVRSPWLEMYLKSIERNLS